tara:strand:- start:454 stop:1542 length:1089 start_codon:yes stop_codon:yes gene_type:complete
MNEDTKNFLGNPVSLSAYHAIFKKGCKEFEQFNNATFVGFHWRYIGNLKEDDPQLNNEGVRADMNSDGGIEELVYDFTVDGWSTSFFPPIDKTDGDWEDGRSRVIAAIRTNQDYIPVARFNFDSENPVSDSVGNALIANNHKQARRSVMEDFIVGGIKCVESGEIARNSDDIMEWLVKKAKVELRFSNDSGIWTKIVNQIIERTSEDKALVLIKEREDWLPWVNGIKGINSKQILLYKAGTGTNASRFWTDHVLPNLGNPKPTILYTTSYSPAKCSEDVKKFKEALEEFHVQTYGLVNNGISSAMGLLTLNAPETLPCKFLGVIPNLKKNGQPTLYNNNQLVSVDDYINDGSPLSKKLKIVS